MSVVAIIPARGGSKAIPRKNLAPFLGQPLVAWSIRQALASEEITDVLVSSDDPDILEVARREGALPVERPADLATDEAPTEAALEHALEVLSRQGGEEPEFVVLLQPTSPLREARDLDAAVAYLRDQGGDSLFSACEVEAMLWRRGAGGSPTPESHDPGARLRRQDVEPVFHEDGSIYVFRPSVLREHGHRLGGKVLMFEVRPTWKRFEIDHPEDLALCEAVASSLLPRPGRIRADALDCIVYDFDGVLTDNRVITLEDGREAVAANRGDGMAISVLRERGVPQFILSSEENPVVTARARKLGIPVMHGVKDKRGALAEWAREQGFALERILYLGNDVNDLAVMGSVGFSAAPSDAHPLVLDAAALILRSRGGEGVVRELLHEYLEVT